MTGGPVIRRATPADAAAAAAITRRNFTETFGHMYPPADLADFLDTSYALGALQRLLADPAQALWLLEQDGEPIGHALAGPCGLSHTDVQPGDGELKRLYVLKHAHNRGLGARLFETVLDWLERDGPRTLWIGVWSENHGAQRFYARYGFEKAGEYEFPVGNTRDRDFILRRVKGSE
jgi:ribosomal protein S18 acetylase RimI-like enzyme